MREHNVVARRRLLQWGLATTAVVGSGSLLAACGSDGETVGGKGGSSPSGKVMPPSYVAFTAGVKADLPGTPEGVADGFLSYPEKPVKATDGTPPGDVAMSRRLWRPSTRSCPLWTGILTGKRSTSNSA